MVRLPPCQIRGDDWDRSFILTPIIAERDEVVAGAAERTASVRWALASLSLSMLMPSLDTSDLENPALDYKHMRQENKKRELRSQLHNRNSEYLQVHILQPAPKI